MSEPFIAEVTIFAGNFAPRGWAFCDGTLLPIAQNTALFSLIGTTYGGDGRTTTQLPDLKGRAAVHQGQGPGLTRYRLGQKVGAETVALSGNQGGAHSHNLQASSAAADTPAPAGNLLADTTPLNHYGPADSLGQIADAAISPVGGGGQAHNNMQPYLALNFIIALIGTYPPRS